MAVAARQPERRSTSTAGQLAPIVARRCRPVFWADILQRGGRYALLVGLLVGCLATHTLAVLEGQRLIRSRQQHAALRAQAQALRAKIEERLSTLTAGTSPIASPPTLLSVQPTPHQHLATKASPSPSRTTAMGLGRGSP